MTDENLNNLDFKFVDKEVLSDIKYEEIIKQTFVKILNLSRQLSENFDFVRVDWLIFQNKIYFNEMTFTPYSGLVEFDKKWNLKLGSLINIER